jgi:hypothetical protein
MKLGWASSRNTKRKEDRAYSLLGLFDVNIPMLYGEGEKAFIRLQEEIMKMNDDESLFAWGYDLSPIACRINGMFAPSPDLFARCHNLILRDKPGATHYIVTNRGVYMDMKLSQPFAFSRSVFGELAIGKVGAQYTPSSSLRQTLAIPLNHCNSNSLLNPSSEFDNTYVRPAGGVPVFVPASMFDNISLNRIYIGKSYKFQTEFYSKFRVDIGDPPFGSIREVYPPAYHSLFQKHGVQSHWINSNSWPDMIFSVSESIVPDFAVKISISQRLRPFGDISVAEICLAKICWSHPSLAAALMDSTYSIPWEGARLDWTDEGQSVAAFIAKRQISFQDIVVQFSTT